MGAALSNGSHGSLCLTSPKSRSVQNAELVRACDGKRSTPPDFIIEIRWSTCADAIRPPIFSSKPYLGVCFTRTFQIVAYRSTNRSSSGRHSLVVDSQIQTATTVRWPFQPLFPLIFEKNSGRLQTAFNVQRITGHRIDQQNLEPICPCLCRIISFPVTPSLSRSTFTIILIEKMVIQGVTEGCSENAMAV